MIQTSVGDKLYGVNLLNRKYFPIYLYLDDARIIKDEYDDEHGEDYCESSIIICKYINPINVLKTVTRTFKQIIDFSFKKINSWKYCNFFLIIEICTVRIYNY